MRSDTASRVLAEHLLVRPVGTRSCTCSVTTCCVWCTDRLLTAPVSEDTFDYMRCGSYVQCQFCKDNVLNNAVTYSQAVLACVQDWWRWESGEVLNRRVLMVALANVQSLLIKIADTSTQGTYRYCVISVCYKQHCRARNTRADQNSASV